MAESDHLPPQSGGRRPGPLPFWVPDAPVMPLTGSAARLEDEDDSRHRLETPTNEVFIAIHKFVRLTPNERQVVNHPAMQRMRKPFQLGQTHLVYPSATHNRFEHSLGAVFMATLVMDTLSRNSLSAGRSDTDEQRWKLAPTLTREERAFTRLGALLHDLGHVPVGHTFEDELGLLPPHDARNRFELLLHRMDWHRNHSRPSEQYEELGTFLSANTVPLRDLIDRLYADAATQSGLEMTATEILLWLVAKDHAGNEPPGNSEFRATVCQDIIGNTICADILDYLYRDWHHLGKHKEVDLRLIDYMEIRTDKEALTDTGSDTRLVVYLRSKEKVRSDGVSAILDMLDSRYHLFEIALYHKTKLCATAMLERVVAELHDYHERRDEADQWREELLMRLLDATDESLVESLGEEAYDLYVDEADPQWREQLRQLVKVTVSLRARRLHKVVFAATRSELRPEEADRVRKLYAPGRAAAGGAAPSKHRLAAMRLLERDLGLDPGSMVMYCATRETSMKVANVNILYNDDVKTLSEHENDLKENLTGRHLAAQEDRFEGLWRVVVACDRTVYASMSEEQRELLKSAIQHYVLGLDRLGGGRSLLLVMTQTPGSPWYGGQMREEPRGLGIDGAALRYPTKRRALQEMIDPPRVPASH